MVEELKNKIERYFDCDGELSGNLDVLNCVDEVFSLLNKGEIKVAEKINKKWIVNVWIKKAILLAFRVKKMEKKEYDSYDKLGLLKYDYQNPRYRKIPPAVIRDGVYIGDNVVVMPSYINVGAYVGARTMIDINAVIGSCAQIGENCHISALACIGGVLEPAVANPVIIENNCFIGVHSLVLEGVIIEEDSVIASGVDISGSTKIIDRKTGEIFYGRVPAGSVVVSGSYSSDKVNISCGVIIKKIDAKTRAKSDINDLLRNN
jgi:2,3,4,5-tetrahydropyridine-2-carboxylate N-succinyltransferase